MTNILQITNIFICNFLNESFNNIVESSLMFAPQDPINYKSALVQVMVWCHLATSHHLNQYWLRSTMTYGDSRPQWVNAGVDTNGKPDNLIPVTSTRLISGDQSVLIGQSVAGPVVLWVLICFYLPISYYSWLPNTKWAGRLISQILTA